MSALSILSQTDTAFAKLAIERGVIPDDQLQRARELCLARRQEGEPVVLADVCVELYLIGPEERDALVTEANTRTLVCLAADCGKQFRLKKAPSGKRYLCKHCGGVLVTLANALVESPGERGVNLFAPGSAELIAVGAGLPAARPSDPPLDHSNVPSGEDVVVDAVTAPAEVTEGTDSEDVREALAAGQPASASAVRTARPAARKRDSSPVVVPAGTEPPDESERRAISRSPTKVPGAQDDAELDDADAALLASLPEVGADEGEPGDAEDDLDHYEIPQPTKPSSDEPKYDYERVMAIGGMGAILRVRDRDIRRPVAMKVILARALKHRGVLARFIDEAQVTGQLEHPNIVPIHDFGRDREGRVYFTMKYVRGVSLAEVLEGVKRRAEHAVGKSRRLANLTKHVGLKAGAGPLESGPAVQFDDERGQWSLIERARNLSWLLGVFLKVGDAVAFAHSRNVVHRDLKPENVMVGGFGEVLVMDWGVAKVLGRGDEGDPDDLDDLDDLVLTDRGESGSAKTVAGQIAGTPSYMPPEQARGRIDEIDRRSDIYALGAMLYEMLTLEPPYEGASVFETLKMVVNQPLIAPRERAPHRNIPPELEQVIFRAMAADKNDRYPSVEELSRDIHNFLEGRTLTVVEYSATQRFKKWVRRNPILASGIAAALLALVAGAFVARGITQREQADERARQIASLLGGARVAARQHDYKDVKERALQVLGLDPKNQDAQGLYDEASHSQKEEALARTRAAAIAAARASLATLTEAASADDPDRDLTAYVQHHLALANAYELLLAQDPPDIDEVRHTAAKLLVTIGTAAMDRDNYDVARLVFSRLEQLHDPGIDAATYLEKVDQHETAIARQRARRIGEIFTSIARGQIDGTQRRDFLFELVSFASMATVDALVPHVSGTDSTGRALAIEALGRFGALAKPAVPALLALVADARESPETRILAIEALGNIGDPRAEVPVRGAREAAGRASRLWARTAESYRKLPIGPEPDFSALDGPRRIAAMLARATALLDKHQADRALVLLKRAERLKSDSADVYALRAAAYVLQGRHARALAELTKALEIDNRHVEALLLQARVFQVQRQGDAALRIYAEIERVAPDEPRLYIQRARLLVEGGLYREARQDADRGLPYAPDHPALLTERGIASSRLGEYDAAVRDLRRATIVAPRNARAWTALGEVYIALKTPGIALQAFDRAIEANAGYANAYAARGVFWANRREWTRARADLRSAVTLDSQHWQAAANLGLVLLAQGKLLLADRQRTQARTTLQEATTVLRAARALAPKDKQATIDRQLEAVRAARAKLPE